MVAKTMRGEFKYQTKTPRPSPYPSKSEENFLRKKIFGTSVLAFEFVTTEEKWKLYWNP